MAQIAELVFLQNLVRGFVLLRIFRSTLYENKAHKFCFFNGFFHCKVFVLFDTYFDDTAMTGNMQLYLGSAQNSNFFPRIFLFRLTKIG